MAAVRDLGSERPPKSRLRLAGGIKGPGTTHHAGGWVGVSSGPAGLRRGGKVEQAAGATGGRVGDEATTRAGSTSGFSGELGQDDLPWTPSPIASQLSTPSPTTARATAGGLQTPGRSLRATRPARGSTTCSWRHCGHRAGRQPAGIERGHRVVGRYAAFQGVLSAALIKSRQDAMLSVAARRGHKGLGVLRSTGAPGVAERERRSGQPSSR